jgi:hypothetical protein
MKTMQIRLSASVRRALVQAAARQQVKPTLELRHGQFHPLSTGQEPARPIRVRMKEAAHD